MRGKVHRHVALVATEGGDAVPHAPGAAAAPSVDRFSLLRLSVPGRLIIVAIA